MHLLRALFLPVLALASLQIGVGIWDATGPISDLVMMGMANSKQVGAGLLQRLRSRAFVAYDPRSNKRFAFVSLDAGMGGVVLTYRVVEKLQAKFPGVYNVSNVAISGTHTHSGPSGFLQYTLFQFSGSGWVPHTIDAMVNGVYESIVMAHNNLADAVASVAVGELRNSSINRSPTAYLMNPAEERARYTGDTDLNMTMLRFHSADGKPVGLFSWFAVHPTSLNNTNLLVAGDHKGYASYLFEQAMNGPTSTVPPGLGKFVAGFPSANLGDVSPNTRGPHCADTGLPCDTLHSTCNNRTELCWATGPGVDMYDSCRIIGLQQFQKAQALWNEPGTPVADSGVAYVHTWVKMPGLQVKDQAGQVLGTLCSAAMGDSFAAGTTDGPGQFDFTQGSNSTSWLWNIIVDILHKPTPEEVACQHPKGILLPTGDLAVPWPWAPDTVALQLLRVGNFVVIVVPTELTTMAGRRLRDAVKQRLVQRGVIDSSATIVLGGLANGYADYTTTFEEYQQQRYEGGSTVFGPHQLNAYIQEFLKLADHMAAGTTPDPGPAPKDFSSSIPAFKNVSTDVLPDGAKAFGEVMAQPQAAYKVGANVSVVFAGADPINDLRPQSSFMEVHKCGDAACSSSTVVAVDGDWETVVYVHKHKKGLDTVTRTWTLSWIVPAAAAGGHYRILHRGSYCVVPLVGKTTFTPYQGVSQVFAVN